MLAGLRKHNTFSTKQKWVFHHKDTFGQMEHHICGEFYGVSGFASGSGTWMHHASMFWRGSVWRRSSWQHHEMIKAVFEVAFIWKTPRHHRECRGWNQICICICILILHLYIYTHIHLSICYLFIHLLIYSFIYTCDRYILSPHNKTCSIRGDWSCQRLQPGAPNPQSWGNCKPGKSLRNLWLSGKHSYRKMAHS